MKVKELKKALDLFADEDEVIVQIGFKRKGILELSDIDYSNFKIQEENK
jgi:hypothetical protein